MSGYGEANVFNTFSFNKWADGKKEEEIDKESRRRRTEQIKRLKERLKKERALRESGYGDMDLEALIEALQMGENINSGVDLKWGGYKVIDGGKGGTGPNRKPRGELPPALQKKDPPPKPPTELTDDYILDEIRKFKKEHPTKESLDETFQNDPRLWQYNRRFAEGMNSESPDSGNATNGMPNDNAARPKTEGGARPRPSFKYNRYVTRDA